ncbi:MAG: TIGR03986 family CRISPR-associated RAMP protein [Chloroflexi bacterium]|nr:TIGR03986 family CRISPR-associated RAMP protein [Chloroflexota bacterium]
MALKHTNPNEEHAAHAPYNFIPLPDVIIKAVKSAEELPDHNRYIDGRHTGHFEVTLETKTPLYIRGMLTETEYAWQESHRYLDGKSVPDDSRKVDFRRLPRNKPDFFAIQETPVIPGSSLRGMLRNLIEIITYSKMKWVTDKKLFFRTMDDSVVGESYRKRMMGNVEGGFLIRDGDKYVIHVSKIVRIHHGKLGGNHNLFDGRPPNQKPKWNGSYHQHRSVWVTLTSSGNFVDKISLSPQTGIDWYEGRLVITGNMPGRRDGSGGKKKEFVFLLPQKGAEKVTIPEALLDRFHDDDQITQWQQNAFPKNTPRENGRLRNGLLLKQPQENEEPIFFLRENKKLTFVGRAQMFRLPYQQRPLDLVPPELYNPDDIDFAEAMFGFVRTKDELEQMTTEPKSKGRAYASRVFVSDGRYQSNQGSPWLSDVKDGIIEPPILASPKPTSFQLYLTQDTPNNRKALYHYDSNIDEGRQVTTLRGFKLYWPQGKKVARDLQVQPKDERDRKRAFEEGPDGKPRPKWNSTQHTRMKPVDYGKKFTFQIHFENLTDVELGALQWALSVPACHRLGMGKPLGMGVVQLKKPVLHLNGRSDRYKTLFSNSTWDQGVPEQKQDFMGDFEAEIIAKLRKMSSVKAGSFQQIERIRMLLKMLTWQEKDSQHNDKQYMGLNDFRQHPQRKVLPDPLNLGGIKRSAGSSSRRRHSSRYQQRSQQQQPVSRPPSPPKKQPPRHSETDDLPEVREEVSDFAKLFEQRLKQQGGKKKKK